MSSLQFLDLSKAIVDDLAPLVALTQLQGLRIGRSDPLPDQFQAASALDLAPLAALRQLDTLDLEHLKLHRLDPLTALALRLRCLYLEFTNVRDLRAVRHLTQLEALLLAGTLVQGLGWEQFPWPVSREGLLGGNSAEMIGSPTPVVRLAPHAPTTPRLYDKTGSTGGFGAYVAFIPSR